MRAYHRIDPLMDERKGHYSPAQLGTFVKLQLIAGRQTRRGRFRSIAMLKGMLPSAYSRHIDFLVEQGDIIPVSRHADCDQCPPGPSVRGEVYVDGWDEWQEGDLTVRDRMSRLRNKQRNGTVTPTVTEPSPAATRTGVGVSTSSLASARDAREVDEVMVAVAPLRNGNVTVKQLDTIHGLREQIGDDRVFFECIAEWTSSPVKDRFGSAMAELIQLAGRKKKRRGPQAVAPQTSYDHLMQSDDDEVGAA